MHALFSSSGKWQPVTMQVRICHFTKFAVDLNTGGGILSETIRINVLNGHRTCFDRKHSVCSISQQHSTIGMVEVDACFSSTDSGADSGADSCAAHGAARVNTPSASLCCLPLTTATLL